MELISFTLFFLIIICIIGFLAVRKRQNTKTDYFLANQNVSPYMLALSSNASKFSGFIFAGFMGIAYLDGTKALWLTFGLFFGSLLSIAYVVWHLGRMNTGGWAFSLGELITTSWHGKNCIILRRIIGLFIIIFLSIYGAAQLRAGGKVLEVALQQPTYIGILLSTFVIVFYCWSGGIRASIWTDAMQFCIMTLSLLLILTVAIIKEGGPSQLLNNFLATGIDEVKLIPQNLSIGGYPGWLLFCIGSIGFGMSAIGQPHVMVRGMICNNRNIKTFIILNYLFEFIFLVLCLLVGLSTRVILKDMNGFDQELALFLSAKELLPPIAIGFILAGILAATLSTADSQILCCCAAFMRDLPKQPKKSLSHAKIGTLSFALLATLIALFAPGNVFSLVAFAYAGLGTSIGSVLILRFLNVPISEWGAILVALSGGITVILWCYLGLNQYLFEGIPGFISASLIYHILMRFPIFHIKSGFISN